jgi:hypothetical protein
LKKRTKKLLSVSRGTAPTHAGPEPIGKSFLLLFSKKKVLCFGVVRPGSGNIYVSELANNDIEVFRFVP